MTTPQPQRLPHAVLDLASRNRKALKIERLLNLASRQPPLRMLEIGTGAGGIAHYFGTHPQLHCDVTAVDVSDNRLVHEGYSYRQVHSVELPFDDASFDVVISNHVIEHVGDAAAQAGHLAEIYRVLHPGGVGYLAVPCRWMLVEPHYRLPFLSWFPSWVADLYVRAVGKGSHYDCRPLTVPALEAMLTKAGFRFQQKTGAGLKLTYQLENPGALPYRLLFRWFPDWSFDLLRRVFPTLIYIVRKDITANDASRTCRPDSSGQRVT
ncbi:methyltransferase domain-containing protein [Rhodanobacter aciditrophus]|uniref:class I SAM-dependent methyltransferase n=1 Tax=Rhodanobacter aciditrophus TaxID=1623218 RepID=UPI003CF84347